VGARPLAITDNLNFGNPERPEVMGEFAAAIRGMATACEALEFPVVSGNVSLYNETRLPSGGVRAILPTPAIGGLGVLDDVRKVVGIALGPWLDIVVVGDTKGWLGQVRRARHHLSTSLPRRPSEISSVHKSSLAVCGPATTSLTADC
jgi:phosphoribosylformylglycinamidine (FGAM) synthase-like enzyme